MLSKLGIQQHFDFVLTSYEAQVEKPSKEIFDQARRLGGLPGPSECLHCGDSRARDVAGALASGWAAVLLDSEGSEEMGATTLKALAELPGFLAPSSD